MVNVLYELRNIYINMFIYYETYLFSTYKFLLNKEIIIVVVVIKWTKVPV